MDKKNDVTKGVTNYVTSFVTNYVTKTDEEIIIDLIKEDLEGLRNTRIVAKRMVFLMRAIADAKTKYKDMLDDEKHVSTHFIKNK